MLGLQLYMSYNRHQRDTSQYWYRKDNLTSLLQNSWNLEDLKQELRPDKHLKDLFWKMNSSIITYNIAYVTLNINIVSTIFSSIISSQETKKQDAAIQPAVPCLSKWPLIVKLVQLLGSENIRSWTILERILKIV